MTAVRPLHHAPGMEAIECREAPADLGAATDAGCQKSEALDGPRRVLFAQVRARHA